MNYFSKTGKLSIEAFSYTHFAFDITTTSILKPSGPASGSISGFKILTNDSHLNNL